jgi:hypothetical protein
MTFPGHEQDNPQRVSAAVNTAGFAQDVVIATSRLIHGQTLTDRDSRALAECQSLLSRMLSSDIAVARSGERQLDGSDTVALLRKARSARPEEASDLAQTVVALGQLLDGQRSAESVEEMCRLRDIFLTVGQDNLATMTQRAGSHDASDLWTASIMNSSF